MPKAKPVPKQVQAVFPLMRLCQYIQAKINHHDHLTLLDIMTQYHDQLSNEKFIKNQLESEQPLRTVPELILAIQTAIAFKKARIKSEFKSDTALQHKLEHFNQEGRFV